MSATNTLNPGHLASSVAQTSPVVEAPKPNEMPGRMPTLNRVVQKLKTPIPQSGSSAARSGNAAAGNMQPVARAKQQAAAEQVDSADLAGAVALRGSASKRGIESKKNNVRFFKALTNGQPLHMEMHVRSIIDSVTDKSATKSLVDSIYQRESPEQRALLKFILLEVAISEPDTYGVSAPQMDKLTQARNSLYERHAEYIEQSKLAIDLAEATAPRMRTSVKHDIKVFQMLAKGEQAGTSMADVLKLVKASPDTDVTRVLTAKLKHWENLAKRDRDQYSALVQNYRGYIITSVVNQIKSALAIIFGLDKIAALCNSLSAQSGH